MRLHILYFTRHAEAQVFLRFSTADARAGRAQNMPVQSSDQDSDVFVSTLLTQRWHTVDDRHRGVRHRMIENAHLWCRFQSGCGAGPTISFSSSTASWSPMGMISLDSGASMNS